MAGMTNAWRMTAGMAGMRAIAGGPTTAGTSGAPGCAGG